MKDWGKFISENYKHGDQKRLSEFFEKNGIKMSRWTVQKRIENPKEFTIKELILLSRFYSFTPTFLVEHIYNPFEDWYVVR